MIEPLFVKAVAREIAALLSGKECERVPEPELLMEGDEQVDAFFQAASREMASIYYFNALHISALIQPGDLVVDLGCGRASQLAILAKLHPESRFLGIDLSPAMLARAEAHCRAQGLDNVRFEKQDITRVETLPSASADVVYSTLVLHHLPDLAALDACFAEIARLLKPAGRLHIHDFARQRSGRAIDILARQYADRRPQVIVEDYRNSMRAAFLPRELKEIALRHLGGRARLCVNPIVRYMMVLTIGTRPGYVRADIAEACGRAIAACEPCFRADHAALLRLLASGGLTRARAA